MLKPALSISVSVTQYQRYTVIARLRIKGGKGDSGRVQNIFISAHVKACTLGPRRAFQVMNRSAGAGCGIDARRDSLNMKIRVDRIDKKRILIDIAVAACIAGLVSISIAYCRSQKAGNSGNFIGVRISPQNTVCDIKGSACCLLVSRLRRLWRLFPRGYCLQMCSS